MFQSDYVHAGTRFKLVDQEGIAISRKRFLVLARSGRYSCVVKEGNTDTVFTLHSGYVTPQEEPPCAADVQEAKKYLLSLFSDIESITMRMPRAEIAVAPKTFHAKKHVFETGERCPYVIVTYKNKPFCTASPAHLRLGGPPTHPSTPS